MSEAIKLKAVSMWMNFSDDDKTIIRFGMFPAKAMEEAEAAGYNGKDLAVALMECANKDGGMVV